MARNLLLLVSVLRGASSAVPQTDSLSLFPLRGLQRGAPWFACSEVPWTQPVVPCFPPSVPSAAPPCRSSSLRQFAMFAGLNFPPGTKRCAFAAAISCPRPDRFQALAVLAAWRRPRTCAPSPMAPMKGECVTLSTL